jgi:hypothetical protein
MIKANFKIVITWDGPKISQAILSDLLCLNPSAVNRKYIEPGNQCQPTTIDQIIAQIKSILY